jgi:AraC-like DNA-binding protein
MKKINSRQRISIHCIKAIDYICDHLHEVITIQDVADYTGLDRTYLGKLFHRETGKSIAEYIRFRKVETAKNMLLYSDFSCAEIAGYLAFSSHSHFSSVFRKYTGMTPLEYRNAFYRKHWEDSQNETD